jgi:hypothetical protein
MREIQLRLAAKAWLEQASPPGRIMALPDNRPLLNCYLQAVTHRTIRLWQVAEKPAFRRIEAAIAELGSRLP